MNVSNLLRTSYISGSGINLFLYQGKHALRRGDILSGLKHYSSALNCLVPHQKDISDNSINNFIVNHKYRFIYCPIPKVACSSFKQLAVQLSDLDDRAKAETLSLPHKLMHSYVSHRLTLSAMCNLQEAQNLIADKSYFKFVFVRNPWDRLVSAYLNKFVDPWKRTGKNLPVAQEVIEKFYSGRGENPKYYKSITFSQFVDYVVDKADVEVDGHWQSQYRFMENINFDFVGKFETIEQDCDCLSQRLQVNIKLPKKNQSEKIENQVKFKSVSDKNIYDCYPYQLLELEQYPSYKHFYNDKTVSAVSSRYAVDIEKFDYCFDS